jgi:co-chaperonin GroES (HSP10)
MSNPKFHPTVGKTLILIDKEEAERKSGGGIILPFKDNVDPSVVEPKKATVVANCDYKIINGAKYETELKIGDRVYVNAMIGSNGLKVLIEGEVYNLIQETDILGKFEE